MLPYIKILYKPRNIIIPVEVKDECILVIKATVCIEYRNIKDIMFRGIYNMWKTIPL